MMEYYSARKGMKYRYSYSTGEHQKDSVKHKKLGRRDRIGYLSVYKKSPEWEHLHKQRQNRSVVGWG